MRNVRAIVAAAAAIGISVPALGQLPGLPPAAPAEPEATVRPSDKPERAIAGASAGGPR